MKLVFGIFLILSCLSLFAAEIRVKKMTQDGELDRSFVLKTNLQKKVVLDCQSFIQGLRIGEFENAYTFMLDPDECDELQGRMKKSLRMYQSHCVDVEQEIRSDYPCY